MERIVHGKPLRRKTDGKKGSIELYTTRPGYVFFKILVQFLILHAMRDQQSKGDNNGDNHDGHFFAISLDMQPQPEKEGSQQKQD